MATISNTPRPGYVWDATDNVWYPIGVGGHGHPDYITQATAVNPTIIDAKGDIITATAADTPARLAVGNNGETLVADSSTATGLKWATPSTPSYTGVGLTNYYSTINSTPTPFAVPFAGADSWDTDAYHDPTTNNTRITIPAGKAGKYLVTTYGFPETFNGYFILQLWLNGANLAQGAGISLNNSVLARTDTRADGFGLGLVLNLAVNDYIQLYIQQGGTSATYRYVTDFQATYLGA
jgi:hypothetical protein